MLKYSSEQIKLLSTATASHAVGEVLLSEKRAVKSNPSRICMFVMMMMCVMKHPSAPKCTKEGVINQ
jgi:hypothetical protein